MHPIVMRKCLLSSKDTALKYPPPTQGGLKLDISQKYTIGNFPVGAVIFNSIKTGKLGSKKNFYTSLNIFHGQHREMIEGRDSIVQGTLIIHGFLNFSHWRNNPLSYDIWGKVLKSLSIWKPSESPAYFAVESSKFYV